MDQVENKCISGTSIALIVNESAADNKHFIGWLVFGSDAPAKCGYSLRPMNPDWVGRGDRDLIFVAGTVMYDQIEWSVVTVETTGTYLPG